MKPFEYNARLVRVVDGDTLDLEIDVGFRLKTTQRVRLMGYNAPELRGPERPLGNLAAHHLKDLLEPYDDVSGTVTKQIRIRTYKGDSFGRWLCDVEVAIHDGQRGCVIDVVKELISGGWGVAWDGSGTRPKFDPKGRYPLWTGGNA